MYQILSDETIERLICKVIIEQAIKTGHTVTVNDGEEDVITKSDITARCLNAMRSTDEDILRFYKGERCVGYVKLIYGNCLSVISDYTDNDATNTIVKPGSDLSDALEAAGEGHT